MADETISTPTETAQVDTSSNVEPTTTEDVTNDVTTSEVEDTSTEEPTNSDTVAETETKEPTLYAGKYSSIEDLEKGYKEAEKSIQKASEFERKYNELVAKNETEAQRIAEERLNEAQARGFKSVEEQQIADRVQVAEFENYWNNLNLLDPQYAQAVEQNLRNYYDTANKAYLNEAKRYFPSEFIEQVALNKQTLQNNLRNQLSLRQQEQQDLRARELANTLRADFSDFLSDLNDNVGKSEALKQFCNAGFINSKEDMQAFQDVYSKIEGFVKERAIKEYEAQKTIEATKQASQIEASTNNFEVNGNKLPTYDEIARMSQAEFDAVCDKYGDDVIMQIS